MYFGIVIKDKNLLGVKASPVTRGIQIQETIDDPADRNNLTGAIVGLPFKDFFIKTVSLPRMEKAQLQEAIDLQVSFHLPYDESAAHVSRQLRTRRKDQALVITATPKVQLGKVRAIVPEPLALVGLALHLNRLTADKTSLLVSLTGENVLTVTVKGFEVVFMRAFPRTKNGDPSGLVRDLKLSCQAVYFEDERHSLTPDQTLIFASNPSTLLEKMAKESFGDIQSISPEDCIRTREGKSSDPGTLLVPCGLAALRKNLGKVKGWNVQQRDVDYAAAVKRGLLYTLPVWPIFLLLYYYGDLNNNTRKIDAIGGKMSALAPKYRQVIDVESDVSVMEEFMFEGGLGMKSPNAWYELILLLEASRPTNLRLNTISGKSYGVCIANGKAGSYPKVTEFIKNLDASEKLDGLTLVYTQQSEKDVDFQITFRMKSEGQAEEEGVGDPPQETTEFN